VDSCRAFGEFRIPVAEKAALGHAYVLAAGNATAFLNEYYRQHMPFGQPHTVAVSVDTVLPVSESNGTKVEWSEDARDTQGRFHRNDPLRNR